MLGLAVRRLNFYAILIFLNLAYGGGDGSSITAEPRATVRRIILQEGQHVILLLTLPAQTVAPVVEGGCLLAGHLLRRETHRLWYPPLDLLLHLFLPLLRILSLHCRSTTFECSILMSPGAGVISAKKYPACFARKSPSPRRLVFSSCLERFWVRTVFQ